MAIVATRLILTPTFDDTKRMTVTGAVAVNEKVAVTIVGVAVNGAVPDGMVLRIVSQSGRVEYARFPSADTDTWTGSGSNATCTLDLATTNLRNVFALLCDDAVVEAEAKLENGTIDNLYGSGRVVIRNWIQNPLDPVAGSTQMQSEIDTLASQLATHQHDGSEVSAQFPHNNLTGRDDPDAHPGINDALVVVNNKANTNTADIATLKGRMDALATAAAPGTTITALNANDDLVAMSDVYDAVRSLITFVNSVKGSL